MHIDKLAELNPDKLKPVPTDLSKLNKVVENNVVKKDVYDAKIKDIEYGIPSITDLATNGALNTKINKVKNEVPNITTTDALTAIKNKIPDVTNLVTKADHSTKVSEMEKNI